MNTLTSDQSGKHTPGPWEVDTLDKYIQIYNNIGTLVVDRVARRERLANNDDGKFSKIELANAKIIAAAPELLTCLQDLYFSVYGGNSTSLQDCINRSVKSDEFEQRIVAVLKKATL